MTDRPILFSGPMIRALIDGRKTQTRRICKPANAAALSHVVPVDVHPFDASGWFGDEEGECSFFVGYQPGDRLWVRETFCDLTEHMTAPLFAGREGPVAYQADGEFIGCHKWKPSIHMPRAASRLTLTVTDVRVQPLQDCSEEDAIAEGISFRVWDVEEGDDAEMIEGWSSDPALAFRCGVGTTAREGYATLWNNINGVGAWDANPWVVAVSFDVRKGNIDR